MTSKTKFMANFDLETKILTQFVVGNPRNWFENQNFDLITKIWTILTLKPKFWQNLSSKTHIIVLKTKMLTLTTQIIDLETKTWSNFDLKQNQQVKKSYPNYYLIIDSINDFDSTWIIIIKNDLLVNSVNRFNRINVEKKPSQQNADKNRSFLLEWRGLNYNRSKHESGFFCGAKGHVSHVIGCHPINQPKVALK